MRVFYLEILLAELIDPLAGDAGDAQQLTARLVKLNATRGLVDGDS